MVCGIHEYEIAMINCFSNSLCIYGGGNRNAQIAAVKKGVEIIIGALIVNVACQK